MLGHPTKEFTFNKNAVADKAINKLEKEINGTSVCREKNSN